jgi:hypothetical protein
MGTPWIVNHTTTLTSHFVGSAVVERCKDRERRLNTIANTDMKTKIGCLSKCTEQASLLQHRSDPMQLRMRQLKIWYNVGFLSPVFIHLCLAYLQSRPPPIDVVPKQSVCGIK